MKKELIILIALRSCSPCPAGIVADTLFFECRGESKAGRYAVASVIWNRWTAGKDSGRTLKGVCMARRQFSCWNTGHKSANPSSKHEILILAQAKAWSKLMQDGKGLPSGTWTHYHAKRVNPYWSKGMTNKKTIGRHLFGNTK